MTSNILPLQTMDRETGVDFELDSSRQWPGRGSIRPDHESQQTRSPLSWLSGHLHLSEKSRVLLGCSILQVPIWGMLTESYAECPTECV
jgi:hypothetical protein